MTGLTRKEVKRLRERADSEEQFAVVKTTPVAHILHRWFTDKEFLSDKGKPVRLAFDGKGTTFTTLVKKFGGDVPPGAMRAELRRIDGILEDDAGNMLPKKRVVYNEDLHERLIGGLAGILYPAALNLAHNLSIDDTSERWPNLTASSPHVRDSDRGRFMRISADRIDDFAKSIDDTYAAYETLYDEERSGTEERAVGVGVFYFEEEKTESDVFF